MTFSAQVKNELCRRDMGPDCCAYTELYGIFLFANTFSDKEIRIVTEHEFFSGRVKMLLKRTFGAEFEDLSVNPPSGKAIFVISDGAVIDSIMEYYGNDLKRSPALHLNAALLEEEHCREAFIRGAFLAAGSVSSPRKNYHLELITRHYNLSREVMALLLDMGFSPKITVRKSNYMIYFKDSEAIEDFLTKCGAPSSAISIMEIKVEKDLRNRVNRRVNCETANLSKTVDAAQRQIEAIRTLIENGVFDNLSEKLKEAARLRMEHPDAALVELVRAADFKVSRSGLNHRLTKLVDIADNLKA
jgi:DNA-binding protein WhiA